jgi:hypothetical protein
MEAKNLGGPAAAVWLDLLPAYPTETLEDGYGLGEVVGGPEPAPPPAPDVARLRAIFDVAAVDPLEEDLGALLRGVEHGRVDPDRVQPEVLAPHVGPRGVRLGDRHPGASTPSTKSIASKTRASEANSERYFMKWLSRAAG